MGCVIQAMQAISVRRRFFETIEVRRSCIDSSLMLDTCNNEREILIEVVRSVDALKSSEHLLCFGKAVNAYEPPGRLWSEYSTDEENWNLTPLNGKWDSISPFGLVGDLRSKDTRADEFTNVPTKIDVSRQIRPENHRAYF